MYLNIGAIPFALSFLVIIIQPIFDMVWMARFKDIYHSDAKAIVGVAKWVSDISAFIPSALLSIIGTLLTIYGAVTENLIPWLIFVSFVSIMLVFSIFLLAVYKRGPERKTRFGYSALQYGLLLLNVIGFILACLVGGVIPSNQHVS